MRTRWLEPLIISLGLTSIGVVGCKGDDGNTENATDDASESAESTGDGDTTTTTTTTDTTTTTTTDTTGDGDTSCTPGELGCECSGGLCLGDLECTNGICSDPNCLPGELACECNNGLCLGDLVCEGGVCLEDGGTTDTTDTTDTTTDTGMECPNANEMMCDGGCVDVLANNDNCGDCGTVCKVYTNPIPDVGTCQSGDCSPTYSNCVNQNDGLLTCDAICGAEGKTCVEEGCNGDTSITGDSLQQCMTALPGGVAHTTQGCATQISWGGIYGACCCAQ